MHQNVEGEFVEGVCEAPAEETDATQHEVSAETLHALAELKLVTAASIARDLAALAGRLLVLLRNEAESLLPEGQRAEFRARTEEARDLMVKRLQENSLQQDLPFKPEGGPPVAGPGENGFDPGVVDDFGGIK